MDLGKTQETIVLVIYDKRSNVNPSEIKTISKYFFARGAKMSILINKSAVEIDKEVAQIAKMKPEKILDIVCIVIVPILSERRFVVKNEILNIYEDFVHPLQSIRRFGNKQKVFIMCGIDVPEDSPIRNAKERDSIKEHKPVCCGKKTAIIRSTTSSFISEFMDAMVLTNGHIKNAIQYVGTKDNINVYHEFSDTAIQLKIPAPPEYVIRLIE